MARLWKKGRGRLGPFLPLVGDWLAESDSPRGRVRCRRTIESCLGGHYLRLAVRWEFGAPGSVQAYEELAVVGVGEDGVVAAWSFTSDGKRSQGQAADVTDLHPEAVGFVSEMPAGLARQAYWPEADGGFTWVVEARSAKGWRRFTEHRYRPVG